MKIKEPLVKISGSFIIKVCLHFNLKILKFNF